jgi:hypothetical protein
MATFKFKMTMLQTPVVARGRRFRMEINAERQFSYLLL